MNPKWLDWWKWPHVHVLWYRMRSMRSGYPRVQTARHCNTAPRVATVAVWSKYVPSWWNLLARFRMNLDGPDLSV
ncbi:hypothetical protein HP552_02890 [Paenibacillus xylanilyticus]|uniref:Uncharacterized protein n=1 Tax=Paenibacillus xylanilyticus TaxID=248903 RepID=A0A7Y6BSR2_9BACL|nr:hypothetical protein [Paenibacillus xylanilyticus]